MPPTVEVGAILMKDWSRMKKLLGLESEAYSGEWTVLKALDVCALDRKSMLTDGISFLWRPKSR